MARRKDITSMRGALEFLQAQNDVLVIDKEVDPILEISGIEKALEGGLPILFNNIKGYPGVRDVGNVFARLDTAARIFDVPDPKKVKFKAHQALRNPIPPRVVTKAPCQEVVITQNIDVMATLPIIKHSEKDGGRILGGGNILLSGKHYDGGTEIVFKRMGFRGKDWGSMFIPSATHLGYAVEKFKGQKVPVTVNICTPPAVALLAGGGSVHLITPFGSDELGIGGGLQGSAVEIVKARTVDAYAVANSEWVLEGYIDASDRVWETDEAEKIQKSRVAPFFPEWPGYMGKALRVPKFQVTAITHRKDRPIFYTPLAQGFEGTLVGTIVKEASYYEFAERLCPGLVADVHILDGVAGWAHVIFQVKKRTRSDEGRQRNLITAVLGSITGMRLVIAVDEDVDIYSADDVLWAIITRANPESSIILGGGGLMMGLMPAEKVSPTGEPVEIGFMTKGGIGIDATIPFTAKGQFERAHYPSDKVDLTKWLSKADIARVQALQSEYARVLAKKGW